MCEKIKEKNCSTQNGITQAERKLKVSRVCVCVCAPIRVFILTKTGVGLILKSCTTSHCKIRAQNRTIERTR